MQIWVTVLFKLYFYKRQLRKQHYLNSDVLLTVRLGIFISVINQLDAQNFSFTIN